MDERLIEYCKKLFLDNDSFIFDGSQNLKDVNNAPDKRGIYLFYEVFWGIEKLFYIGKSGTLLQDGTFQGQGLKGRIENVRNGVRTEVFFRGLRSNPSIEKIKVYSFVTMSESQSFLPAYVEGKLLQMYYSEYKQLPKWNEKF